MKQLLILSGKGGTGKTTIASMFIALLNAQAYADCDVDAPNLHLMMKDLPPPKKTSYFGLNKARINPSLCQMCGRCYEFCQFQAIEKTESSYRISLFGCEGCGVCDLVCPCQAIIMEPSVDGEIRHYQTKNILFTTAQLKMGKGNSGLLVSEVKNTLIKAITTQDLAILDGAPGIGCPVIASLNGVDMVLIVTEPSISGYSDFVRLVTTAQRNQVPLSVCINKYDLHLGYSQIIEDYCHHHSIPFVGCIPYDEQVIKLTNKSQSLLQASGHFKSAMLTVFQATLRVFNQ